MKKQQVPAYTANEMSKEQFFYAYQHLAQTEKEHILLESGRDGRYSIAGVNPLAKIEALDGNLLKIVWREGKEELIEGDPLESLMQLVQSYEIEAIPELPEFQGGIVGFISYDYVRHYEKLPNLTRQFAETPDLYFYLFDEWAVLDIQKEMAYFMALPDRAIDTQLVANKWLDAADVADRSVLILKEEIPTNDLQVSVTGPEFEKMVEDVQAYIEKGDVIQVNLSVRQSKPISVKPLDYYKALRQVNPSPYMAFIGAENFSVASSSPELLVKKRGNQLATRPIGGTRRRGASEIEDLANEKDLLADEKEKAEHIMLVELEKEDFTRVCEPETVEANEFMIVERYSHVMHLVSNVRGVVAEGQTNADIVKAVFPGGTITGAPKIRTMEIIEELEPEKRGLYTGSIGWFGFNGDLELNVVIRTAFIQDEVIHIQAGAGLVADSVPKDEYIESLAKGQALWQAKATAEKNKR